MRMKSPARSSMMSEWLDLMLGEIARKKDEEAKAIKESARRNEPPADNEEQS